MEWMNIMQEAVNYIESNITESIDSTIVAKNICVADHNFSKYFSIITGFSVSEYIRNRRLSLAGKEMATMDCKVIDIALKYGYDSPESFTKAFTKFHGISPSETKRIGMPLKFFEPLTIQIIVKGGFTMVRKMIPNVVSVYINSTENYMFNSCMSAAMRALNQNKQYDFLYFAGVTGDIFTQTWNEPRWKYNDCLSGTCHKTQIPIKAAFDACGYEYEYVYEDEIKLNKDKYIKQIVESIDKGYPVLTFGIVGPPVCSIICGYERDGEVLIGRAQFSDDHPEDKPLDFNFAEGYFQKENGLDESVGLIFFIRKVEEPNIASVYRKAINQIKSLATMPANENVSFGKEAIDKWAESFLLEDEFNQAADLERPLDTYISCMVMVGTNMFNIQKYLDRALEFCPDMDVEITKMKKLFSNQQEILNNIVEFQGGYFFEKDRNALLSESFRKDLSDMVHALGEAYFTAAISMS